MSSNIITIMNYSDICSSIENPYIISFIRKDNEFIVRHYYTCPSCHTWNCSLCGYYDDELQKWKCKHLRVDKHELLKIISNLINDHTIIASDDKIIHKGTCLHKPGWCCVCNKIYIPNMFSTRKFEEVLSKIADLL